MGHVFAEIELSNPRRQDLTPVAVKALADTGALMLCIPEHVAIQLDLEAESMREVSVADGRSASVPYVGPIRVSFGKRFCYVGALVLGDEVLLGSVPMEDMDLVVNPGRREITVDPASPNLPHARVKQLKTDFDLQSGGGDVPGVLPAVAPIRHLTPRLRLHETAPVGTGRPAAAGVHRRTLAARTPCA